MSKNKKKWVKISRNKQKWQKWEESVDLSQTDWKPQTYFKKHEK